MPSLLTQIVTGPARLWLLGAAIFSIFIGLVIGAPATARLEAGEEDGEAEWLDDRAEAVGSLADEAGADVDGEIETDHETDGAEDLEEVGAEDASGDPELLDDVEDAENEAVSSECGDEVELVDGEVEADEESEEEGEPEYVEPIDQHADEIDPEAIEEVDESAEEELDEGDPAEQPEDSIDGAEETSAEVLVEMKIGEIDPEPTGGLEGGVGWVEPKSIDPRRAKREKRRERRRRAAERRAARQHAKHGGISHEASGTEDEGDLD